MQIAPNGLATHIKLTRNRPNTVPLVVERANLGIARQPTAAPVLALPLLPCTWFAF